MGDNIDGYLPLFETKQAKGTLIRRFYAIFVFLGICMLWFYRATQIPNNVDENGRWGWIALFLAEIWFTFYWVLTQIVRWKLVYRYTFKDRLSTRYENNLPKVDIFVCTADPVVEPPIMVINTVLSVMAYDYPPEKLSIYLSDDGGSVLTFYALFEASHFSKHWLPYCRKYNIEPRSPLAYFSSMPKPVDANHSSDLASIKKLYEEMQDRIEISTNRAKIPEEVHDQHKGFSKWDDLNISKHDHDTILQILIDGRNVEAKDVEGFRLPTLVYLAREKRPKHFHNFKAGAMNALIRVSSEISNGTIILNVDCDMYSNNSQSIRDALCFFMDEKKSKGIAFVQFPQKFENVTKNDIYGSSLLALAEVETPGLDGVGGPAYIGTGCFHQREVLCGRKYTKGYKIDWEMQSALKVEGTVQALEERAKELASCTYELNSLWGKEMGLKYGCLVEDVITGLAIQCRGWRSIFFNPERSGFLGLAATTLADTLVQHKRWSEGDFHVFLNQCRLWYGHRKMKISLGHQLGYCNFCLWALNALPTLCYCTIPCLYMLRGISLFPKISSPWFLPLAFIVIARYTYSLAEFLCSGGTVRGWWNEQRIWLYKRTSSYLFALLDIILKSLGFSDMKFVITNKVVDEDVSRRYENEMMEFGVSSPMFILLTSLALMNLFSLVVMLTKLLIMVERRMMVELYCLQILLCCALVVINIPLFEAVFIRKDKGKMPSSVIVKATLIALLACALFLPMRL